jgi:hypothetical protein
LHSKKPTYLFKNQGYLSKFRVLMSKIMFCDQGIRVLEGVRDGVQDGVRNGVTELSDAYSGKLALQQI